MGLATLLAKAAVRASDDILDLNNLEKAIAPTVQARFLEGNKPITSSQQQYMIQVVEDSVKGRIRDADPSVPRSEQIKGDVEGMLDMRAVSRLVPKYRLNAAPETKAIDPDDEVVVNMIEDYMAVQPQSELISNVHKRYLAEQIVLGMREGQILDSLLPKGSGDLKFPTKGDTLDLKVKRSLQRFDEDEAEIPAIQERKLEKFLEGSAVQQPVFRAISFNPEYDWDARFAMRNEVGPHYGSEGQANYIAMQSILGMRPQELLMNTTTRRPAKPKEVDLGGQKFEETGQPLMDRAEFNNIYEIHRKARSLGWNPTKYDPDESKLASLAMSNQIPELDNSFLFKAILNMKQNDVPPTVYKGYLSIKNPMLLDDGTWTAEDFFTDYTTTKIGDYYKRNSQTIMDEIVQRVASETGQSLDSIKNSPAYLDMEQSASRTKDFTDLLSEDIEPGDFGDFGGFNQFDIVNQVYLDLQRASTNRKFVEFLESYGYDGIAYPNKAEPAFADDEEILSYIPFRPEQFKLESAFDFDVDDPRMFMAEGGVIQHLIRKGDTLSKISKETGVSVADLVRLNKIKNPDFIRAGDKLILGTAPENVSDRQQGVSPDGTVSDLLDRGGPPIFSDLLDRGGPDKFQVGNKIIEAPRSGIRRAAVRRSVAGPQDAPAESRSLIGRSRQRPTRERTETPASLLTSTPVKTFVTGLFSSPVLKEDFLRLDEYKALRGLAKGAIERGRSGLSYRDYNKEAGSRIGYKMETPTEIATDPFQALKFTLGKAEIVRDGDKVVVADEFDFSGDDNIAEQSVLDKVKFLADRTGQYFSDDISAYGLAHSIGEVFNPEGSGPSFRIGLGNKEELGISDEQFAGLPTLDDYTSRYAGRMKQRMAKGGKVDKKKMACNKPKRTPNHPKKSHVVKACKDGKEKIIRFGEQGAKTAGKPKAGESKRMKAKRKSFKARHRKNIKKGNMSAAYWADKVKW
jgi:murein DD-endopeptidase MepM/ murein hydrolase activator NlpD